MKKGKTFVTFGKPGRGRTYHISKQTPFLSIDKEVIVVGDMILQQSTDSNQRPMKVCFGEYQARGEDDWGVKSICHGYYIEFHDGGVYSLTQDGGGYSIAAKNCKIVK